jgi:hypothetical protein
MYTPRSDGTAHGATSSPRQRMQEPHVTDVRTLEIKVARLERKLDELIRLLKRSDDDAVQFAARRAGNT